MTREQVEALRVLADGMASTSPRTKIDVPNGIRTINGGVAVTLVDKGLARRVPHWNAVEITEAGRNALASYA